MMTCTAYGQHNGSYGAVLTGTTVTCWRALTYLSIAKRSCSGSWLYSCIVPHADIAMQHSLHWLLLVLQGCVPLGLPVTLSQAETLLLIQAGRPPAGEPEAAQRALAVAAAGLLGQEQGCSNCWLWILQSVAVRSGAACGCSIATC